MKKIFLKLIEKELIVVLAVVVLLGILIGYSLAAALRTIPETTTLVPDTAVQDSLMRAGLGEGETN